MNGETHKQKLIFDYLMIEVTRKCNLQCAHCLRGEPQEVDISSVTIDNLLEQTAQILRLFFSGGEPTLNLEIMRYTLEQLRARGIPLHSVEIITNGVLHSAELVNILRDYSEYIRRWNSSGENLVRLAISVDEYHVGNNPREAINYYTQALEGFVTVTEDSRGENPIKVGRASSLPDAFPRPIINSVPHQIHTLKSGEWCGCKYAREWEEPREGQSIVCCPLHLSAIGDITRFVANNCEYIFEDTHRELVICNVAPGTNKADRCIESGITKYNAGMQTCAEAEGRAVELQNAEYQQNPSHALKDLSLGWKRLKNDPKEMNKIRDAMRQSPEAETFLDCMFSMLDLAADADGLYKLARSFGVKI